MSKLNVFFLLLVSCTLTALITGAVVLYIDVKPSSNTFAEAGDYIYFLEQAERDDENMTALPTASVAKEMGVGHAINIDDDESLDNLTEKEDNLTEVSVSEYYRISGRDKYHVRDCRYIKDKDNVEKVSETVISEQGLEACKVCVK